LEPVTQRPAPRTVISMSISGGHRSVDHLHPRSSVSAAAEDSISEK
jgi:hypothetical protein